MNNEHEPERQTQHEQTQPELTPRRRSREHVHGQISRAVHGERWYVTVNTAVPAMAGYGLLSPEVYVGAVVVAKVLTPPSLVERR